MKYYKSLGFDVIRAAGSHGTWDLIATDWKRGIVEHVQCKMVSDLTTANRLLKQFRENPPFTQQFNMHQTLEVKVKGSTEIRSVTR